MCFCGSFYINVGIFIMAVENTTIMIINFHEQQTWTIWENSTLCKGGKPGNKTTIGYKVEDHVRQYNSLGLRNRSSTLCMIISMIVYNYILQLSIDVHIASTWITFHYSLYFCKNVPHEICIWASIIRLFINLHVHVSLGSQMNGVIAYICT